MTFFKSLSPGFWESFDRTMGIILGLIFFTTFIGLGVFAVRWQINFETTLTANHFVSNFFPSTADLKMDFSQIRYEKDMTVFFNKKDITIPSEYILPSATEEKKSYASYFFTQCQHVFAANEMVEKIRFMSPIGKNQEAKIKIRLGDVEVFLNDKFIFPGGPIWIPVNNVKVPVEFSTRYLDKDFISDIVAQIENPPRRSSRIIGNLKMTIYVVKNESGLDYEVLLMGHHGFYLYDEGKKIRSVNSEKIFSLVPEKSTNEMLLFQDEQGNGIFFSRLLVKKIHPSSGLNLQYE